MAKSALYIMVNKYQPKSGHKRRVGYTNRIHFDIDGFICEGAINLMIQHQQNNKLDPLFISKFLHLLEVCLNDNICKFKGLYNSDGRPVGGFLSSLVADVYMNEMERQILSSSPHTDEVLFWRRFVDDITCIWVGSETFKPFMPN